MLASLLMMHPTACALTYNLQPQASKSVLSNEQLIACTRTKMTELIEVQDKANESLSVSFTRSNADLVTTPAAQGLVSGIVLLTTAAKQWCQMFATVCAYAKISTDELGSKYIEAALQILHSADVTMQLLSKLGAQDAAALLRQQVSAMKEHLSYIKMPAKQNMSKLLASLAVDSYDDTVPWQTGEFELFTNQANNVDITTEIQSNSAASSDRMPHIRVPATAAQDDGALINFKFKDESTDDNALSMLNSMWAAHDNLQRGNVRATDGGQIHRKKLHTQQSDDATIITIGDIQLDATDILVSFINVVYIHSLCLYHVHMSYIASQCVCIVSLHKHTQTPNQLLQANSDQHHQSASATSKNATIWQGSSASQRVSQEYEAVKRSQKLPNIQPLTHHYVAKQKHHSSQSKTKR
jgi:hypothetical protein